MAVTSTEAAKSIWAETHRSGTRESGLRAILSETRVGFSRLVTSRTQANADSDEFTAVGIGGYNPTTSLNGGSAANRA